MALNTDYCVAIRTLGMAGENYQRELDSIMSQTIKPKKILVYIAEGYPLPKETVGVEEYVRCPKGMVAQRALPFSEVDTTWCLFLDDDVWLAPDTVEKMLRSSDNMQGDCIAADTFKNQDMSIPAKVMAILTNWATPRPDDEWAFKIGYTATFSYNAHPSKDAYLSQSAAGPCSLWRMEAYRSIHFADELWMDRRGFAYGDDILFFHKLFRNGGRLLVHYASGAIHLDAQSARSEYAADHHRFYVRALKWFCIWWRTQYDAADVKGGRKVLAAVLFMARTLWELMLHVAFCLMHVSLKPFLFWLKGLKEGWGFVHSEEYKSIPNFIVSK